ncbi:MAG: site-specific integrase [Polaromonas sp.]
MTDVTAMDPADFFKSWQQARLGNKDLKPMGAAGLQQTALIWRQWLAFCAGHGMPWDAAHSADIARFCQAIGPRSKLKKTSPVTLRRYWRVLHDMYAHALASGVVAVNPAKDAKPPETERVPSLALPTHMWIALHEGLPVGNAFKDRRNRLALLLMMGAALTVREIIGLTLACAHPYPDSPEAQSALHAGLPLLPPQSAHGQQAPPGPLYTLRVRKTGAQHERIVLLDPLTSQALHDWLQVRCIGLALVKPESRLIVGDKIGQAIAPNGLYNICQAHLMHCLVQEGFMAEPAPSTVIDPGSIQHLGPNTLRNTCIVMWFNSGVPLAEIQRRCGFKDASVMSRLGAHLLNPFPV